MHLKVFLKLKKTLKTLSSGQKTQKNPKNPQKTKKNPLSWFFFKKPRFFATLPCAPCAWSARGGATARGCRSRARRTGSWSAPAAGAPCAGVLGGCRVVSASSCRGRKPPALHCSSPCDVACKVVYIFRLHFVILLVKGYYKLKIDPTLCWSFG